MLLGVVYFISATFFEPKAYNFFVRNFSAKHVKSSDIVLIVIDDKSLTKIRWPWKRELYGKIFKYLGEYSKTKVIGFDAIFRSNDTENPDSDTNFYNDISTLRNFIAGFVPSYEKYSSQNSYDKEFKDKFSINVVDRRENKMPSYYRSLSMYPQRYFDELSYSGSVMTTPDFDGYIRAIDQFVDYKGSLYPSLSLRMYEYLNPNTTFYVGDRYITTNMTDLKIPVSLRYNGVYNNIRYYKNLNNSEYAHKTYSAIDIIDSYEALKNGKTPKISPKEFDNKIVFVGANAKAIAVGLQDVKKTPMSDNYPGVEIQATNLENLLNNDFITLSSYLIDVIILIFLLGATFLIIKYTSLAVSVTFCAAATIIYLLISALLYNFGIAVSVITPITLQVVMMSVAYSYRFILEGRNKE